MLNEENQSLQTKLEICNVEIARINKELSMLSDQHEECKN